MNMKAPQIRIKSKAKPSFLLFPPYLTTLLRLSHAQPPQQLARLLLLTFKFVIRFGHFFDFAARIYYTL